MKTELLSDWKQVKLIDVSLDKGQYGSGASAIDYNSKKPRYVRITDIDDEGQIKDDGLKSPSDVEEKYFLEYGDFLFARSGSVGRTYLHEKKDGTYQYAGYLIRFKLNQKLILPKYLYYVTKSKFYWEWIEKQQKSVTISNINAQQYANFKFLLPSILTQKKIVSILEKAEKLKEMRDEADQLTKDFPKAIFSEIFGNLATNPNSWPCYRLSELTELRGGIQLSKERAPKSHARPYLTIRNVYAGRLDLSDVRQMEVSDNDLEKWCLKSGDLLVLEGGDRDDVGRTAIFQGELENCVHQNHVFRVRVNQDFLMPEFLMYYLNSDFIKAKFFVMAKATTGINSINMTQLKSIEVICPPMEYQKEFFHVLEKVGTLKNIQKQSKDNVNNLFDNLMQKAFKGELAC
ncbi:MAG: restriction endonuclease subunit S [Nitrosotalea sp.]